jgi:hypothetical protein
MHFIGAEPRSRHMLKERPSKAPSVKKIYGTTNDKTNMKWSSENIYNYTYAYTVIQS